MFENCLIYFTLLDVGEDAGEVCLGVKKLELGPGNLSSIPIYFARKDHFFVFMGKKNLV